MGETGESGRKRRAVASDTSLGGAEGRFGLLGWAPQCLQWLHRPWALTLALSTAGIVQGFVINGLIPVIIPGLEQRYSLNSKESAVYSTGYDIATVLVLLPVAHLGGRGHKGRWLASGMLLFAAGSALSVLPKFLTPPYCLRTKAEDLVAVDHSAPGNWTDPGDLCPAPPKDSDCDQEPSYKKYYAIFLAGQLLHGVGASPLYTLGYVYLDENVPQVSSPLYLAIYTVASTVGPAVGYLGASLITRLYVEWPEGPGQAVLEAEFGAPPYLHHRWLGAWWLGFALAAAAASLFALPLFCFARRLPGYSEKRAADVNQEHQSISALTLRRTSYSSRQLPRAILRLLKNATFSLALIMQTAEAFMINALVTFMPKFLSEAFKIPGTNVGFVVGVVTIPGIAISLLGSAFFLRRFKLQVKGNLIFAGVVQVIALGLNFCLLIHCPPPDYAGLQFSYAQPPLPLPEPLALDHQQSDPCHSECQKCLSLGLRPVCNNASGQSFVNACFAGCRLSKGTIGPQRSFKDCACAKGVELIAEVCPTKGGCDTERYIFLAFFAATITVTFSAAIPIQSVSLRCIPFGRRSLAMGLTWIIIRIFGTIPGPILVGSALDLTCELWAAEKSGSRGPCLLYSATQMSIAFTGFMVAVKVINIFSLVGAYVFYRPPKGLDEDPTQSAADDSTAGSPKRRPGPVLSLNHSLNPFSDQPTQDDDALLEPSQSPPKPRRPRQRRSQPPERQDSSQTSGRTTSSGGVGRALAKARSQDLSTSTTSGSSAQRPTELDFLPSSPQSHPSLTRSLPSLATQPLKEEDHSADSDHSSAHKQA